MDPGEESCSAGTSLEHESSLVGAEPQPSDIRINHRTIASSSISPSRSSIYAQSTRGADYRNNDHRDYTTQDHHHQPHLHPESSSMPDNWTRSTSYSGPFSLPKAHASGLDPTVAPPVRTTKPSHRNPYQYLQSHPHLTPSNVRRSLSDSPFQKPGEDPPFSPPFLHPLSFRTTLSRAPSPLPASTRGSRDSKKPRTKFAIGSSRPNSPMEPEPTHGCTPTTFPSRFNIRGFLALSTFDRVVVVLFACCVFVLARALFGVGHSAEKCGVYAHETTDSGPRSGAISESSGVGLDTKDGNRMLLGRIGEDEQAFVWLDRVEEMSGYQYDWKVGGYGVGHDDDGGDRYDDEYEHEDFSDPA